MDAFFADLGRRVLERWQRESFALAAFPALALAALEERPPAAHVDVPAFVRDLLANDAQPAQTHSGFGQPEIVAYEHPRFYVQVLFWMDGTTDIHQHQFSGAFHVLAGSSIHARYTLENARAISPHFRVGDVRMQTIELLTTGRSVPIASGSGFIHSLFHLERPSITVVVRTHHDPEAEPQFNYLPPSVALDPSFDDTLMTRREQLLSMLEQIHDPAYPELVLRMVADLDFERGFAVLRQSVAHLAALDAWDMVLDAFRTKHGALADGVAATLAESARRAGLVELRSTITDPEHRFFLALLLNVPTRSELLGLVARRFPDSSPTETVLRWTDELVEPSDDGAVIVDALWPSEVEVAAHDEAAIFAAALRWFVAGGATLPAELRALDAADVQLLRTAVERSSLGILLDGQER